MEPWFDENEKRAMAEYLDEGGWLTEFKRTQKFEEMLAEFTSAKHCIVVNNGTISLTLALTALGLKPGDEVIVPNFTMIATPNSAKLIGCNPIFVDVDRKTLCMDFELMKKAVTAKTKAVILVNANGRYPQIGYQPFLEFCRNKNISFIEDSAQALGCFYPDGKHQGTISQIGSFSFSAPKVITTGQGGALITHNDELAYKLKRLKDFGRAQGGLDVHDSIGYNFKFTEMQAVIGIEQMKKLEWRVERKKKILERYQKNLLTCAEIEFFETDLKNTTPWFIDILCERRIDLITHLKLNSIGTRVMYPPINKQKAYQVEGEFVVSNLVGEKGLWLPSQSQLTDDQIDFICEKIINFYNCPN